MKSKPATVAELSQSQQAVLSYQPSGKLYSLTLIRGRQAWPMSGNEADKLKVALSEKPEQP